MFVDPRAEVPFQGDIFTGIPFTVHLPEGKTRGSADNLAMLLSHECDLAKPVNEVALLASVMSAADSLNPGNLGHLKRGRLYHAFHLVDPPGFGGGDWYVDCRFITAVRKDVLTLDRRIASLDDETREALRGHLIRFWVRTV